MLIKRCGLAALVLTMGAATCLAQEALVSPKEIQDDWVGKAVIGTTSAGAPLVMKMQSDGTATVEVGKTQDTGKWRLSDNGYCATWKTIRAGTERCLTVRRDGSKLIVLNPDGSINTTVTEIK